VDKETKQRSGQMRHIFFCSLCAIMRAFNDMYMFTCVYVCVYACVRAHGMGSGCRQHGDAEGRGGASSLHGASQGAGLLHDAQGAWSVWWVK